MQIAFKCDTGKVRELNEDSLVCLSFDMVFGSAVKSGGLFVVADGMGGHNAGEVASRVGAAAFTGECLMRLFEPLGQSAQDNFGSVGDDKMRPALEAAAHEANKLLFEMAKQRQALQGMGTTLTAALVMGQDLYVVQIGDSRCYIFNNREVIQVTRDHSQVQEMVDAGLITAEEARVHPKKNVITRVLGYYQQVTVDSYHLKLFQGDNILLCSDGLWGVLSDQKISETVRSSGIPDKACTELVAQANRYGGPDNISVVIVRPEQLPSWDQIITARTQIMKKRS
jgi:serine/threonine protein phosphatase PrpC